MHFVFKKKMHSIKFNIVIIPEETKRNIAKMQQ